MYCTTTLQHLWIVLSMQCACVLLQVGKGATQLPQYMTRMYEVLSVFELQMPFVPLDCYQGSSPFTFQVMAARSIAKCTLAVE